MHGVYVPAEENREGAENKNYGCKDHGDAETVLGDKAGDEAGGDDEERAG